ncbi:unnamed protein product [Didymodactylos carnosus]|uniref:Uncharacterized protein n=1 Tax=Didymodactylos carnosus TaxID=1234261 RepID=A0A815VIT9_9BILA|nr:unnamed protein product [Didymodactylos carnosus]CAF1533483.1 unnamed protein product [Didymodactylos carnosus]CAF4233321.1 unnamed protein product [Didymodactylos carnosus]CAF4393064.1 unnamed protein product [Didymodactylos carnosus]
MLCVNRGKTAKADNSQNADSGQIAEKTPKCGPSGNRRSVTDIRFGRPGLSSEHHNSMTKAMGVVQDKFSRDSDYQRGLNEVELEKLKKLAELEAQKNEHTNELDRQKLEMEKNKAKAEIEAELFQTRLRTQSSLFEKFVDYMRATLDTNTALIQQQGQLYALIEKTSDPSKSSYFTVKADKIEIMQPSKLMAIGLEKVKELNLKSSEEIKYLESRLEDVLGIMGRNNRQLLLHDS